MGGIAGGLDAAKSGKNIWTGGEKATVYNSPVSDNLGKQNGECVLRCLEESADSYGMSKYDHNYWYKENGSKLGVHASDVESLIEGGGIFNSDPISANPYNGGDVSGIADALANDKEY